LTTITGLSSSYFWNTQCWSGTSEDWLVLPIGKTNTLDNPCLNVCMEPWIFNIKTNKAIRLATRTSDFWNPYDYYSGKIPGSTTAAIQLSPATLDFTAYVGDANPASKAITAFTASGTLSGLTVSHVQSWITATPAATSGASIVVTNAINISGKAEGVYKDTITVGTTSAGSKTYIVTLTLQTKAIFTKIQLTPSEATIASAALINSLPNQWTRPGTTFPERQSALPQPAGPSHPPADLHPELRWAALIMCM
jgi:hypothetical protein